MHGTMILEAMAARVSAPGKVRLVQDAYPDKERHSGLSDWGLLGCCNGLISHST